MIEILASVLAADPLALGADVARMLEAGVDGVHVDIMDGHFVPNLSFGPSLTEAIARRFPALHQDVHLMLSEPARYAKTFIQAGAGAVTVHVEAQDDTAALLRAIRESGVPAGVSLKPATPVERIAPLLPLCDLVLVMTVEPGFGGQRFMPDMLPKIRSLRRMGYRGKILVDGGVQPDNAGLCAQVGADALVMGTALLRAPDAAAVVRACRTAEARP